MESKTQIFENKDFGQINVIDIEGQPWFAGKDVARALGYYQTNNMIKRLDSEDFIYSKMEDMNMKVILINESGLYTAIIGSKLPTAKAFKRWVTSEILPSIRKHGAYITNEALRKMREDQVFAQGLIQRLTDEKAKNAELLGFVDKIAPKAHYCDIVLQYKGPVQASIIAHDYGMTAIAFNKLLHELGIQYKIGKTWLLYKAHMNNGYTVSKTYLINGVGASVHTCWTQKGRMWLYGVLKMYSIHPEIEKTAGN